MIIKLGKLKIIFIVIAVIIIFAILWQVSYNIYLKVEYPKKYSDIVQKYAKQYNIEEALIFAVIKCESGFFPNAESSIGAKGLMQITEDTFNWAKSKMKTKDEITYSSIFDVDVNIKYGSFVLSQLLAEFGTIDNALCAYHAGWGSVKRWLASPENSKDGKTINNIPYRDTKIYVQRVNEALKIYRGMK
jgi:soluble lytic murein transglycosylase